MRSKRIGYRLSPRAQQDLEEIWLYTFRQWSSEQADGYVSDLLSVCESLVTGEKIGLNAGEIRQGYALYFSGAHSIYYTRSDQYLDVIRILHQSRDVAALLTT